MNLNVLHFSKKINNASKWAPYEDIGDNYRLKWNLVPFSGIRAPAILYPHEAAFFSLNTFTFSNLNLGQLLLNVPD